jgi:hypothetical protein
MRQRKDQDEANKTIRSTTSDMRRIGLSEKEAVNGARQHRD